MQAPLGILDKRGPGLGGAILERPGGQPPSGREALFARELDRARVAASIAQRQEARQQAGERLEERRAERQRESAGRERPQRSANDARSERAAAVRAPQATNDARGSQQDPVNPPAVRAQDGTAQPLAAAPQPTRPDAPGAAASEPARSPLGAREAVTSPPPAPQASTARAAGPTPERPILSRPEAPPASTVRTERSTATATPERPQERAQAARVAEQLLAEIRPQVRQALVVLQPADLGRVAVRIRVTEAGLTAVLRAESPDTLKLMERHLPELLERLQDLGFGRVALELGLDGRGSQRQDQSSPEQATQEASARERSGAVSEPASPRPRVSDGSRLDTLA